MNDEMNTNASDPMDPTAPVADTATNDAPEETTEGETSEETTEEGGEDETKEEASDEATSTDGDMA